MVELVELANAYATDKGTVYGHSHNYASLYSFLLEQFRSSSFAMLEIGLQQGGVESGASVDRIGTDIPSIKMWLDYFPNATIHGFDLSHFDHISLDRFEFHRGDLTSKDDLAQLAANLMPLKLVIDDGSHASYHQQLALISLFPAVEPGGFYIIEDFHWQPPFEDSLPPCMKTATLFENYIKSGVLEIPFATTDERDQLERNIENVFIHRSNTGGVSDWHFKMVALQKKRCA